MKTVIFLIFIFITIPVWAQYEVLNNLDYISPFHNGIAALKKDNLWAFINKKGDVVVPFRSDLVPTQNGNRSYPICPYNRCLIEAIRDGINYFGYIDAKGKTIKDPQFLNATNYQDGRAIVLKLVKEEFGTNDILDKMLVNYNYLEVAIDTTGSIVHYLQDFPTHITLSKEFLRQPPKITTKFISDSVVAVLNKDRKWAIKKLDY